MRWWGGGKVNKGLASSFKKKIKNLSFILHVFTNNKVIFKIIPENGVISKHMKVNLSLRNT